MGGIRVVDVVVGYETSVQPTAVTPSNDADVVTKGYADDTYTRKDNVGGTVADVTALKGLDSGDADRIDDQIFIVIGKGYYYWDSASTTPGDDDEVVTPSDITEPAPGRWILDSSAGGGGGSGGMANLYLAEQKAAAEQVGVYSAPVPNSVVQSFVGVADQVTSYVWDNYTSGTALVMVHDPRFLESGDEDTDSATNWAAQAAATSLTATNTAGEFRVGTHGLKFNKDNSATSARIRYDAGSVVRSAAGFTELFFWINLPSLTNLSSVEVRMDIDGTNYQSYTATLDHKGNALATGWQLIRIDLSTAGTTFGTGWDKSKLFRYFHVGVVTSSATQTYTGIIVDGVVFSRENPASLGIKTYKRNIYNSSTVETLIVSSASAREAGEVTLAAGLSNAYTAGFKTTANSKIQRSTHLISDNKAQMLDGLSGAAADLQTSRKTVILPAAVSSANFQASIGWGTDMTFKVTAVVDSDTIEVSDAANSTANIVSGRVFDVFQTIADPESSEQYVSRLLPLTVSSSSHSSGTTTINTGTNTGIAVGDTIVMRQVSNERLSCVGLTANENFQALTNIERNCINTGLQYPRVQNVLAHYNLGGKTNAIGTRNNKSNIGGAVSLTTNGTINQTVEFLPGIFGAGPFSDSDYFSHPNAGIQGISADSGLSGSTGRFSMSCWVYLDVTPGSQQILMHKTNGSNQGWYVEIQATTARYQVNFNSTTGITTASVIVGRWNHLALAWEDTSGTNINSIWLNGVETKFNGTPCSDSGFVLDIGRYTSSGIPFNAGKLAQLVFWANYKIDQGIVNSIYNGGRPRPLGNFPQMLNRYEVNALTGQKLSMEADTIRTTDATDPFLTHMVAAVI